MAGHSKWANIKRRKASQDAQKNKLRTRLIREIVVAVRTGGVLNNPRLQVAVQQAKKENLPKSKIEEAIKRGEGGQGEQYTSHAFEAYAPLGVALLIDTVTDNHRRTVAAVRSVLNKYGGKLATNNLFVRKGVFSIPKAAVHDEDALTLELLEAGIDTFEATENFFHTTCPLQRFDVVKKTLDKLEIDPGEHSLEYLPSTTVSIQPREAERILEVLEALEATEDVQQVYDNMQR